MCEDGKEWDEGSEVGKDNVAMDQVIKTGEIDTTYQSFRYCYQCRGWKWEAGRTVSVYLQQLLEAQ